MSRKVRVSDLSSGFRSRFVNPARASGTSFRHPRPVPLHLHDLNDDLDY